MSGIVKAPRPQPPPERHRRTGGRRSARLARQRRRARLIRLVGLSAGLVLLGMVAALLIVSVAPSPTPTDEQDGGPGGAGAGEQDTLLLVFSDEPGGGGTTATLLASGSGASEAIALFVPVGTLVDIPGYGLDRIGSAAQYGGAPLATAALENALGIDVDHAAGVDRAGFQALLGRLGGLRIDVPERLVERGLDGSARVRFEAGLQLLDGRRLAEYWAFRQRGEDELAALARQERVLRALFGAFAEEPELVQTLVGDGAPQLETTATADWLAEFVRQLTAAYRAEALEFLLLPVTPFGGAGTQGDSAYRIDEAAAEALTSGPLAASVPEGGGADAIRVQVLNGVGTPGIGQEVDRALEGGGFRIVLSDNARSFDFARTRILVYDESARSLNAARRVQELLGVGTIEVSRQPQSVVEITIVVGADFQPGARSGATN